MGWVLYAGLGDGLADSYWEDYDNMQSSAGIVRVSDYATTLFIRASWTDFNPEEGKYAWDEDVNTKAAQRFKMLVEGAAERGLKLAFAVIIDSQDKSYDFTPAYVKMAVRPVIRLKQVLKQYGLLIRMIPFSNSIMRSSSWISLKV